LERCVLDGWLVVARVGLIAGAVRRVTAWREVETKKIKTHQIKLFQEIADKIMRSDQVPGTRCAFVLCSVSQ